LPWQSDWRTTRENIFHPLARLRVLRGSRVIGVQQKVSV
jgi:hypothetical protein